VAFHQKYENLRRFRNRELESSFYLGENNSGIVDIQKIASRAIKLE
jgi:hypothetical protein